MYIIRYSINTLPKDYSISDSCALFIIASTILFLVHLYMYSYTPRKKQARQREKKQNQ